MAIEIKVTKSAVVAVTAEAAQLPLAARLSLTWRRRRLRRLQQGLVTTAWVAGAVLLILLAGVGLLSLH